MMMPIEHWPMHRLIARGGHTRETPLTTCDKVASSVCTVRCRDAIVVDNGQISSCGHTLLVHARKRRLRPSMAIKTTTFCVCCYRVLPVSPPTLPAVRTPKEIRVRPSSRAFTKRDGSRPCGRMSAPMPKSLHRRAALNLQARYGAS